MNLQGRFGVITGGTGALGSSIALACLAAGAKVAVTYRSEAEWQQLRVRASQAGNDPARLDGLELDLTDATATAVAIGGLLRRAGPLDFLVCAAGGFVPGNGYDTSEKIWAAMLDINLLSAVNAIRPVAPAMVERESGTIITVSSASILDAPGAGIAAYAVSKEALRRLSEILAVELRPHGVGVYCILPATMDTPGNRRAMPGTDPAVWVSTASVASRVCELLAPSSTPVDTAGAEPPPVLIPVLR